MKAIEALKCTRLALLKTVEGLSEQQLVKVPSGFNNSILWNLAHLAVTQQLLNYKLSGLPMYLSEQLVEENKKGTSPASWSNAPDINFIKQQLIELPETLDRDYSAGKFKQYNAYMTSAGFELRDIDDSIIFNGFHEGIHLGTVMALKKLV